MFVVNLRHRAIEWEAYQLIARVKPLRSCAYVWAHTYHVKAKISASLRFLTKTRYINPLLLLLLNSITLAGSNQLRTSSEPDSVMEFGFYRSHIDFIFTRQFHRLERMVWNYQTRCVFANEDGL